MVSDWAGPAWLVTPTPTQPSRRAAFTEAGPPAVVQEPGEVGPGPGAVASVPAQDLSNARFHGGLRPFCGAGRVTGDRSLRPGQLPRGCRSGSGPAGDTRWRRRRAPVLSPSWAGRA